MTRNRRIKRIALAFGLLAGIVALNADGIRLLVADPIKDSREAVARGDSRLLCVNCSNYPPGIYPDEYLLLGKRPVIEPAQVDTWLLFRVAHRYARRYNASVRELVPKPLAHETPSN